MKVGSIYDLEIIVDFYSGSFPEMSMNWLDVSGITDMNTIFCNHKYNGDISHWDVSNVINMTKTFCNS